MIKEKGSILIFTLWVLIILAILSIILSHRASSDVRLAKYESDNIKARYLAKAGVMKMLAGLAKDRNDYDSLNEDWNRGEDNPKKIILRNDTVLYGASDEMARLNLNSATFEHLVRLGLDNPIAEKIVAYAQDKKKKGAKGFEFIEELFLVEGMTREIYSAIKDSVTIYGAVDARVNINTASEKVLHAIIGDDVVNIILEERKGDDREEHTEDDGIEDISEIKGLEDTALFTVKSDIFHIWAKSVLSGDKKPTRSVEAVVDRTSGKIYHWKEY